MKQKLSKGKRSTDGRSVAPSRKTSKRNRHTEEAQTALAVLMALLHADRWVFEAGELAKKAGMSGEDQEFHDIRISIVKSLNKLQPLAYGAMEGKGLLSVARH